MANVIRTRDAPSTQPVIVRDVRSLHGFVEMGPNYVRELSVQPIIARDPSSTHGYIAMGPNYVVRLLDEALSAQDISANEDSMDVLSSSFKELAVRTLPTRDQLLLSLEETALDHVGEEPCAICFEAFHSWDDEKKRLRHLPVLTECGHVFGLPCIEMWTRASKTCPMCREVLFEKKVEPEPEPEEEPEPEPAAWDPEEELNPRSVLFYIINPSVTAPNAPWIPTANIQPQRRDSYNLDFIRQFSDPFGPHNGYRSLEQNVARGIAHWRAHDYSTYRPLEVVCNDYTPYEQNRIRFTSPSDLNTPWPAWLSQHVIPFGFGDALQDFHFDLMTQDLHRRGGMTVVSHPLGKAIIDIMASRLEHYERRDDFTPSSLLSDFTSTLHWTRTCSHMVYEDFGILPEGYEEFVKDVIMIIMFKFVGGEATIVESENAEGDAGAKGSAEWPLGELKVR
ncbi:hypothetical protein LTR37_019917 [Vermiconidia calcicola]|uniref:Uncharacterized protein n=1 Tax=Vermiconidia calcicola TaxID=1690605 RepID=A0ACC3MCZ8_9PEZI|nr:hypothetical protein LTR37_019917 [Vermiconidia calcicola]